MKDLLLNIHGLRPTTLTQEARERNYRKSTFAWKTIRKTEMEGDQKKRDVGPDLRWKAFVESVSSSHTVFLFFLK